MVEKLDRIILHIGSHKTGTTAIQEFAAENRDRLRQDGILYPLDIFDAYPRQHSGFLQVTDPNQIRDKIDQIAGLARAGGVGTVLLSGEDMWAMSPAQIIPLAEACQSHFRQHSFALVLRNPVDYFMSSYKHDLKFSDTITDFDYVRRISKFSPRDIINKWREKFSLNAHFMRYDAIKDDMIGHFFEELFGVRYQSELRRNVSSDLLTLQVVNTFLKEWMSPEVMRILHQADAQFPQAGGFSLETVIAENFRQAIPEEAWSPIEYRGDRSLQTAREYRVEAHDPLLVCDKMLFLFAALREHFVSLDRDDDGQ